MAYCILAYPLLVHLSVLTGMPVLAGAALVVLYAGSAWPALAGGRGWAWALLPGVAAASAWLVHADAERYALYLPPIVLPLALVAWWAPTLRAGRTPFVTQLALRLRGPISREHAAYTRGVTMLWVAVCAGLSLAGAAAALWAEPPVWSAVTNLGSPLVVAGVFVVEYAYRRWHLRHEAHPNFVDFLRQIARAGARPGA